MTINEFRNALRCLLNDAIRGGIDINDLLDAAEAELHPPPDDFLELVTEQERAHD